MILNNSKSATFSIEKGDLSISSKTHWASNNWHIRYQKKHKGVAYKLLYGFPKKYLVVHKLQTATKISFVCYTPDGFTLNGIVDVIKYWFAFSIRQSRKNMVKSSAKRTFHHKVKIPEIPKWVLPVTLWAKAKPEKALWPNNFLPPNFLFSFA